MHIRCSFTLSAIGIVGAFDDSHPSMHPYARPSSHPFVHAPPHSLVSCASMLQSHGWVELNAVQTKQMTGRSHHAGCSITKYTHEGGSILSFDNSVCV